MMETLVHNGLYNDLRIPLITKHLQMVDDQQQPFESKLNKQSLQLVVSYNFKSNPKVYRNFHFA